MPPELARLWTFLPLGFVLSVALETPVLLIGLSPQHSLARRLFAGVWLTACTYPIVILVLPPLITPAHGYFAYVTIAEIFAPTAECGLFWLAFARNSQRPSRANWLRDMLTIVIANLVSWLVGAEVVRFFVAD